MHLLCISPKQVKGYLPAFQLSKPRCAKIEQVWLIEHCFSGLVSSTINIPNGSDLMYVGFGTQNLHNYNSPAQIAAIFMQLILKQGVS